jgi:hypothetical protein
MTWDLTWDDLRSLASVVRELPLEAVLLAHGAVRDRRDRRKWQTELGPISITGAKFTNWQLGTGGGGAIDLAMHLGPRDYRTAVLWLAVHVAGTCPPPRTSAPRCSGDANRVRQLRLPVADIQRLRQVRRYLQDIRRLPSELLDPLIACGRLYADHRGNAVFLLVAGKPNRAVGAELRGTGPTPWRGMASGSRKDAGYFWIGEAGCRDIILCESAIDAISCHAIHRQHICISTSGVRTNPPWLQPLIKHGYRIHCGFDADPAGDTAAQAMLEHYSTIRRLRPAAKDWNDVLATS